MTHFLVWLCCMENKISCIKMMFYSRSKYNLFKAKLYSMCMCQCFKISLTLLCIQSVLQLSIRTQAKKLLKLISNPLLSMGYFKNQTTEAVYLSTKGLHSDFKHNPVIKTHNTIIITVVCHAQQVNL